MKKCWLHKPLQLFSGFVLFACLTAHAQKLSYSDNWITSSPLDVNCIAGKEDDSIFVWTFQNFDTELELNVFNNAMHMVNKTSLQLNKLSHIEDIHFFKKDSCKNVLVQYSLNHQTVIQIFSFDNTNNAIVPSQVLQKWDVYSGLNVKYSNNGAYTALLQKFTTSEDSVLIQYTLFNNQSQLINNTSLLLPQNQAGANMDAALLDNSGNLFFSVANDNRDATSDQNLTIYEINPGKDSLLVNNFFKKGSFSDIQLQENKRNRNINVSGIVAENGTNISSQQTGEGLNFFVIELDNDLTRQGEITMFAADKIMDSVYYSSHSYLKSLNLIGSKDSVYNFYLTGITDYKEKHTELFGNLRPSIPPQDLTLYHNYSINSTGERLAPNVPNVYQSYSNENYGTYNPIVSDNSRYYTGGNKGGYTTKISGNNFFTFLSVNKQGILAMYNFKDKALDMASLPQFEYVANTGNNIHYVFSRLLKNKKQLVSDIVFDKNGSMQQHSVITNTKYQLFLNESIQVSPGVIIIPYVNHNRLSFAKMELD